MFRHVPENQIRDIENAVLERCGSVGSVVHIYVDKRSTYVSYINCWSSLSVV